MQSGLFRIFFPINMEGTLLKIDTYLFQVTNL